MADPTSLTSDSSTTDAASYDTASITPSANALVLVAVISSKANPPSAAPTLSGNGLTFVEITTVTWSSIATPTRRVTLFRAMGASPSAGAITIDFGGTTQTNCLWSVVQYTTADTTGTNGSGAIVQSATNAANSANGLTVTLAAFGDTVNNWAYGCFSKNDIETIDPGAGFTEFHEAAVLSPANQLQAEWKLGEDTSVDVTHTGTARNYGGIAVEVKAAAGGAAVQRAKLALLGVGV